MAYSNIEPAYLFDLPKRTPAGTPDPVSCPALMTPMIDMQRLDPFYTGDGSQSDIDGNALASYIERLTPVNNQKSAFMTLMQKAILEPVSRPDVSACIIKHLMNWATKGALQKNLLGPDDEYALFEGARINIDEQHHQAVLEIAWTTVAFSSAYTVALIGGDVTRYSRGLIDKWFGRLAQIMIHHMTPQNRQTTPIDAAWIDGTNSNRAYSIFCAVACSAVFTRNAEHWFWALDGLEKSLDTAPSDGKLPREIDRDDRALQYMSGASMPLIIHSELAARNGYKMSVGRRDKLAAICHFTARFHNDPVAVAAEVSVSTQVNTAAGLIGFGELAAHHFTARDPEVSAYMRAAVADDGPQSSTFWGMPWSWLWPDPATV